MKPIGLATALFMVVLSAVFSATAAEGGALRPDAGKENLVPLTLGSASFPPKGMIPPRHTCDGADISPQLAWAGLPAGTQSLVLIVDDPDAPDPAAPAMTWVHWVLYNLPPSATGLGEGVKVGNLPPGTRLGLNDWQRTGYGGPCPPIGKHRYVHKLYALDVLLPDLKQPTKARLEQAMQGHVLARAELVGYYQRQR
ncbi:MAG: YbhB/YbcL family Raf kinase inhibitor-like protein [Betaproteobacteria bacterium]|nr:YbhB/YbcL family Raf kinase inhibitor-like protein [Betaproteobacteria bacterium]